MCLEAGQVLYLEGAEDFDLMGDGDDAETFQVKNSGKNITLGSKDVRDAIENFWLHIERNRDRPSLKMRFVTRGDIGSEQGNPFNGLRGIDLWRIAADGDDEAALRLARYLGTTLRTPSLLRFLELGEAGQLRSKLFQRIVWATNEPSTEAVQLAVERMAIEFGDERDIDSNESRKAVDGLLNHCTKIIKERDPVLRSLTRADLIKVFEAKTSVMLPARRGLSALLAQALAACGGHGLGYPSAIEFGSATLGVEPSLPPFHLPRRSLVETSVKQGSPILVVGSEGRGKTTVASLIGKELGGVACWVDLSALSDASLPSALDQLLVSIRTVPSKGAVIVDDFPVANSIAQAIWARFCVLIEECARQSRFLILTAKGVNPEAIDPRLRTNRIHICPVPDLAREEVVEFLSDLGCPDEKAPQFASAILARSGGGHPKLVHLLGLELQATGWIDSPSTMLNNAPTSIEEARTFARHTAARTLQQQDLELLYSLSLAFCPLGRQVIVSMGESLLGLPAAGDALDRLVGRWVESHRSKEYRITALLFQQATKAWTSTKVARVHACIFDAITGEHSVSVDKAFPLFMHAWESGDDARLAMLMVSFSAERRILEGAAAELLLPMVFVGRDDDKGVGRFSARSIALLRLMQFRIAKKQQPSLLPALAMEWKDAIGRIEDTEQRDVIQFMWAISIADSTEQSFGAHNLIHALEELHRLEGVLTKAPFDKQLCADLCPYGEVKDADWIAVLFGFNFVRCDSIDLLRDLLDALESSVPAARERMLKAFAIPLFCNSNFFVEGPWRSEINREMPRWQLIEQTMRRMLRRAKEWGAASMGGAVARVLSILYEDHLSRNVEAITCLREAAGQFGESPVLIAQEAAVYFGRQQFKQSLDLWKDSLWRISSNGDRLVRDPLTLRKAGIAAGTLRDFGSASEWFESAARSASESSMPATAGGALFDAAYCAFKDGARTWVISLLLEGLSAFEQDFDPSKQFDLFAAKKLGGHVLLWMLEQLRGKFGAEPAHEPILGQCSNPGRDKQIAELPKLPSDMATAFLVEIASLLNVNISGIDRLRSLLGDSRVVAAGYQFWSLRCDEVVASGQLEGLSSCVYRLNEYFWRRRAQERSSLDPASLYDAEIEDADRSAPMGMAPAFSLALLLRALSGGSMDALADDWIGDFEVRAYSSYLIEDVRTALRVVSVNASNAPGIFNDVNVPSIDRLGAVFRLLLEKHRKPRVTATCQAIALAWLPKMSSVVCFDGALASLAKAFSTMWREHIRTPALLLSPRMSVGLLNEAIHDDGNPPQQLAQLLQAAAIATGVAAPRDLLEQLDRVAALHRARAAW
ncbi:hypothetical protein PI87_09070 [Ralstonia sp. A12]|nr:hypothetical protein PI87_09070 [Ralstonia sp. A12]